MNPNIMTSFGAVETVELKDIKAEIGHDAGTMKPTLIRFRMPAEQVNSAVEVAITRNCFVRFDNLRTTTGGYIVVGKFFRCPDNHVHFHGEIIGKANETGLN